MTAPDTAVSIGSMSMKNPVMIASGIFGYGDEFRGLADYGELGALVLKTVTRQPREGNPPGHRTVETPAGMLNAIGSSRASRGRRSRSSQSAPAPSTARASPRSRSTSRVPM